MSSLLAIKQRFGIVGNSPLLERALDTAARVSSTDLTVLISGESGVGKEVFSKIIHALSPRKHNQFIAVNCGAIPAGTINSELFGHEKGAFTGALQERKGYFETVDGGTIFLDEVSEMPLDTQAYLLRVLESGEFMRVGSSKVQTTDVRVIAATNVTLEERVRKGKFREDLFYRLNTVPIKVPSLSERREDVYLLFRKFALDIAERYRIDPIQLDDEAKYLLDNYRWPGNVRELKNVAEQISVLSEKRLITAEDLLSFMPNIGKRNLPVIAESRTSQENLQEREILFKFLFEMKNDLNDVKSLIFELVQQNNLEMPDSNRLRAVQSSMFPVSGASYSGQISDFERQNRYQETQRMDEQERTDPVKPIIIERPEKSFGKAEVVEENLSLTDMEKELICKALKKHNGRRKDAAEDLGISERTLYRKIKEYDIE